jgi:hypothetical protein
MNEQHEQKERRMILRDSAAVECVHAQTRASSLARQHVASNTDIYFTLAPPSPATIPVGFHVNTHCILDTRIDACLFDNGPAVDDSTATSE